MSNYQVINTNPSVEEYCILRVETGLSPKSIEAAEIALKNTWYGLHIKFNDEKTVGMGRIIGDGGCFFQIVDIAVKSEHQGKGLGKLIMEDLINYFKNNAPQSAYVSFIADGDAKHLYEKYGFKPTAPESIGMFYKK